MLTSDNTEPHTYPFVIRAEAAFTSAQQAARTSGLLRSKADHSATASA